MMMRRFFYCLAAFAQCALLPATRAQFYAPDTEYHDPVQRVFVVEAARVLAWLYNLQNSNMVEVAYQVTTKPDQTTCWDLRWLDAAGKAVKSATISYPPEKLKAGAAFYRETFKDLWMLNWVQMRGVETEDAVASYWEGANKMGLSREDSLDAASQIAGKATLRNSPEWVPQLAGLLAHASLPGEVSRLSLDNVLLARSAAWLALTEINTSAKLDGLWSPVLFQAGRERAASALWNAAYSAKLEGASAAQTGWNLWLRKAPTSDLYLFATTRTNLPMAMPILAWNAIVADNGALLGELTPELTGNGKSLLLLHNYAPIYSMHASVGAGHLANGAWPFISRLRWISLLASNTPPTNEIEGYATALQNAQKFYQSKFDRDAFEDVSLAGLEETAPLLNLARKEGAGPLKPAGVATFRDLLNYGWEMAGLQLGSRHRFVRYSWGVHDLAETLLKECTGKVDGWMPFFAEEKNITTMNFGKALLRLQNVSSLSLMTGFDSCAFDEGLTPEAGGRLFIKRCWLRPMEYEWQAHHIFGEAGLKETADLMQSLKDEGGGLAALMVLRHMTGIAPKVMKTIPHGEDMQIELAESLPQPTPLYVTSVYSQKYAGLGNFEQARALEKLYWTNPDSHIEHRIFRNYVVSPSYKCAKRFYLQSRENLVDSVSFSNIMGKMAYMLGYVTDDADVRKMAMEDSSSGSYSDMVLQLWDAALNEDLPLYKKTAEELIERYEGRSGSNSTGRMAFGFLPYISALKDPKHPSRKNALNFFGKEGNCAILRWIWIEKYKIPAADAITLMGGHEVSPFQEALVCYLEKDAAKMLDAVNLLGKTRNYIDEYNVLAIYLYCKLHPLPFNFDESDLKPQGATSTRNLVLKKLGKK